MHTYIIYIDIHIYRCTYHVYKTSATPVTEKTAALLDYSRYSAPPSDLLPEVYVKVIHRLTPCTGPVCYSNGKIYKRSSYI